MDAKLRSKMRQEISALHKEVNATILYVTHDQVEAMTMGNKVVVLDQGVIQQIGSPKDLYENPINKFVAGFIGSPVINFVDVTVEVADNTITIHSKPDFLLEMPISAYPELAEYDGQKVCLGIRPEDLKIVDTDTQQGFSGSFDFVEYLGAECNILMRLRSGQSLMLRTHNSQKAEGVVRVLPSLDRLHFFDIDTEQRI